MEERNPASGTRSEVLGVEEARERLYSQQLQLDAQSVGIRPINVTQDGAAGFLIGRDRGD